MSASRLVYSTHFFTHPIHHVAFTCGYLYIRVHDYNLNIVESGVKHHNPLYSIFSFMCMFCRPFFVLLCFFFWPLCCLFFDIRILITPLVSSNSSFLSIFFSPLYCMSFDSGHPSDILFECI
jgi:hypothetical protein